MRFRRSRFCPVLLAFLIVGGFSGTLYASTAATFLPALETYPDGTDVPANQSFEKTWTVRNSGTTTWNSGYYLQYLDGSLSTNRSNVYISGTVPPGSNYTFRVPMRTPSYAGTQREEWRFKSPSGATIYVDYSSIVWASINVTAPPSVTSH